MDLGGDADYSSPYLRAVNTARPFAAYMQLGIIIEQDLRERHLSPVPLDDWQDQLRHSFAGQAFADQAFALPGGESMVQTRTRGLGAPAAINAAGHGKTDCGQPWQPDRQSAGRE